jgi:hypothetical protein
MDVELRHTSLTYKMIGGVVDLFICPGPTPKVWDSLCLREKEN